MEECRGGQSEEAVWSGRSGENKGEERVRGIPEFAGIKKMPPELFPLLIPIPLPNFHFLLIHQILLEHLLYSKNCSVS